MVDRLITNYMTYTLAKNEVPDMYVEEEIGPKTFFLSRHKTIMLTKKHTNENFLKLHHL